MIRTFKVLESRKPLDVCFTCLLQMEYQMRGMERYNPKQLSERYISDYESEGEPNITCDVCDKTVRYERVDDRLFSWKEVDAYATPALRPTVH